MTQARLVARRPRGRGGRRAGARRAGEALPARPGEWPWATFAVDGRGAATREDGAWAAMWAYLIGSMVAGFAVTGLGWLLGSALDDRRRTEALGLLRESVTAGRLPASEALMRGLKRRGIAFAALLRATEGSGSTAAFMRSGFPTRRRPSLASRRSSDPEEASLDPVSRRQSRVGRPSEVPLSRRRARVRVPSLPLPEAAGDGGFSLSWERSTEGSDGRVGKRGTTRSRGGVAVGGGSSFLLEGTGDSALASTPRRAEGPGRRRSGALEDRGENSWILRALMDAWGWEPLRPRLTSVRSEATDARSRRARPSA